MEKLKTAYKALNDKSAADKAKRLSQLNKAARPLTPVEMEKPYYRIALGARYLSQFITFAAGLGFLLFLNSAFDSLFVIGLLGAVYFAIEPVKDFVNKRFHSYRLHQPYIPKPATFALVAVSVVSILCAALGSGYGYDYVVAKPALVSLDSVQAEQDALIKKDTAFWSDKAQAASATASAYFTGRSWKGRISSKDNEVYKRLVAVSSAYKDSLTQAQNRAVLSARAAVASAKTRNAAQVAKRAERIEATKWAVTCIVLALELLVIFLFKWCADFVERERIEGNALAGKEIKAVKVEKVAQVETPHHAPQAAARVEVKHLGSDMQKCACGCGKSFEAAKAKRFGKKFFNAECKKAFHSKTV